MCRLDTPRKDEYNTLLKIWESSVRYTHHFLTETDIEDLKKIIQEKQIFTLVNLTYARDDNNTILAFIGVVGENIEMLFVDADYMRRGIGKNLLLHAVHNLKANKVDVNEQNKQAVRFYERFGFKIVSRCEVDAHGKPFPILHMQLR